MKCPTCGKTEDGVVLVCRECWFLAPAKERGQFRNMFCANPKKEAAWRSKADKILRLIREKRAATHNATPQQIAAAIDKLHRADPELERLENRRGRGDPLAELDRECAARDAVAAIERTQPKAE